MMQMMVDLGVMMQTMSQRDSAFDLTRGGHGFEVVGQQRQWAGVMDPGTLGLDLMKRSTFFSLRAIFLDWWNS